jgi:hypothetical protein
MEEDDTYWCEALHMPWASWTRTCLHRSHRSRTAPPRVLVSLWDANICTCTKPYVWSFFLFKKLGNYHSSDDQAWSGLHWWQDDRWWSFDWSALYASVYCTFDDIYESRLVFWRCIGVTWRNMDLSRDGFLIFLFTFFQSKSLKFTNFQSKFMLKRWSFGEQYWNSVNNDFGSPPKKIENSWNSQNVDRNFYRRSLVMLSEVPFYCVIPFP